MTTMAEHMFRRASSKAIDARNSLAQGRNDVSVSDSIEAIEFSAKAAFLVLSQPYPKRHKFTEDELAALFDLIPDNAKHLNFPRLFVLYRFWTSFYTMAKYGDEKLNVAAVDLLQQAEADLALKHASAWTTAVAVLAANAGVYV